MVPKKLLHYFSTKCDLCFRALVWELEAKCQADIKGPCVLVSSPIKQEGGQGDLYYPI
jgi:hypothetical protein